MKKIISILISLVLLAGCFSLTASAQSFVLDYDLFYMEIPNGFNRSEWSECTFFDDDVEFYINVAVFENQGTSISDIEPTLARDMQFYYSLISYGVIDGAYGKGERNGLHYLDVDGHETNESLNETVSFVCYMFATQENVFLVYFERFNGEFTDMDYSIITSCMYGFLINGTYIGDDSPTVPHTFSTENIFEVTGSDVFVEEPSESETTEANIPGVIDTKEDFMMLAGGIGLVLLVMPTVILLIAAIALIVNHGKHKKKLKKYEGKYGPLPSASPQYANNPYAGQYPYAQQNAQNPYSQGGVANTAQQNPYGNQPYAANGAQQPVQQYTYAQPQQNYGYTQNTDTVYSDPQNYENNNF